MSQNTFEVMFNGKLVKGAAPEKVKANVAALFKVEVAKVERLFSGALVSIKKGVDEATAKKYQMALYKAGAITQVVNRAVAAAPSAKPAAVKSTAKAKPSSSQVKKPAAPAAGAGLQKSVVKPAPAGVGELASVAVDAPGTVLVAHQETRPPQIDTSGLSMDQVGVELTEYQEVAEPEFDLSGLTMGGAEEALGEESPFEPLQVDVSGISMDEPGATLVEHKEEKKPVIDTSNLSLE